MLVGGSVRDQLLGIESKDFDLEVYGVDPARLRSILKTIAPVNTVGEHFAVYKLAFYRPSTDGVSERYEIDVSLPRRESKTARGHRGFVIEGDPDMSFQEAARRRDFTINAIMQDPITGEIIDPFGGLSDLQNRRLKAVAPETFIEDSLRVLRAIQLAARFEMIIEAETVDLCRSIDLSDLPRERTWGEIEKLLTLAARPSIGVAAALDLGVLDNLFPEIRALAGCLQDPTDHPEGDAFDHTLLALDNAIELAADLPKERRIAVLLALLCHDLGKPVTKTLVDGRIAFPNHAGIGVERARSVMGTLGVHTIAGFDVRAQVLALVGEHLSPGRMFQDKSLASVGAFRRLAAKVDLDLLYRVVRADALARGPASSTEMADWFIARVRELGLEQGPPAPLLLGRHLLEEGFAPGPLMGRILREVYELQLDDQVTTLDEAIAAARRLEAGSRQ